MTDLGPIFERLGLDQYLDAFVGEGFETWETVLDIQETDLDALNVKLGHRRKLQREIANYRGVPYERIVGSPATYEGSLELVKSAEGAPIPTLTGERPGPSGVETKRKYRRHPKPDENAPERPPSAYVIFSNKIREEVKGENLSFTAIAKLVGDRWQKLDPAGKEPYEAQAATAKERYNLQLSAYKKTEESREYSRYLADFKAKHGTGSSESKRPKLEAQPSGGSASTKSLEMVDTLVGMSGHVRISSVGSMGSSTFQTTLPSPVGLSPGLSTLPNPILGPVVARLVTTSPHANSPPSGTMSREGTTLGALSTRSSLSEDSSVNRGEHVDPIPRASRLTLTTPPPGAPVLPPFSTTDPATGSDPFRRGQWTPGYPPHIEGQMMSASSAAYSRLPPGALPGTMQASATEEQWKSAAEEASTRGYFDVTRTLHGAGQPPTSATFGSLPLPAFSPTERQVEYRSEQRILPPPRPGLAGSSDRSLGALARSGSTPRPQTTSMTASSALQSDANEIPLDSSENEAINTLADLASRGSRTPRDRGPEGKHRAGRP